MCPQGVRAGALGHRRASLNRPSSFTIWEVRVLQGFFFFMSISACTMNAQRPAYLWVYGCGAGEGNRSLPAPLPLPQGSAVSLVLWCFPWASCQQSSLYIAAASQALAKSPVSLVTCDLEALVIHQNEVILR